MAAVLIVTEKTSIARLITEVISKGNYSKVSGAQNCDALVVELL
jgi:hypothetical protein